MATVQDVWDKYVSERDKRLRPETEDQYVNLRHPSVAHLDLDRHVDYDNLIAQHQALANGDDVKVLIVGGGIHGICTGHQLVTKAGLDAKNIVIVDSAGGFGGTWYWNRYPGLMCDIESSNYLPLLEETGYMPKHRYAYGAEIRNYLEHTAKKWNLQGMFCTTANGVKWDGASKRWMVKLTQDLGPRHPQNQLDITAQFVIVATGVFGKPHIPKLNGAEKFASSPGKLLLHTARWDWAVSGGSQDKQDMVNLRGKKVGIIGTGATAVQVLPAVSEWAERVTVFQRTPSYIGARGQAEITPEYWAGIAYKKGWQYERMDNLNSSLTAHREGEDLVNDGWSGWQGMAGLLGSNRKIVPNGQEENHVREMLGIDLPQVEASRRWIREQVSDPIVAQKLEPWYAGWCKRPAFHDHYLSSFNKPNVILVDTAGKGVESYSPNGIFANGEEHELDVLILATGFSVYAGDNSPAGFIGCPIVGVDGKDMSSWFRGNDFGNLFGIMSSPFPNLFYRDLPGGTHSTNLTSTYVPHVEIVAHIVKETLSRSSSPNQATVQPDPKAEVAFMDRVEERANWFSTQRICTPGYFNLYGLAALMDSHPLSDEQIVLLKRKSSWGEGPLSYQKMTREWIAGGDMAGLVVS